MKKILNTGKFILRYLFCWVAIDHLRLLNRKKVSSEIEEKKVLPIKGGEMTVDGIEIVV